MAKKYVVGFDCLNEDKSYRRTYPVTIATAIEKGDLLILTSGYAALATTLTANTLIGVAGNANTAAEAVANGTVDVQVIPLLMQYQFRAAVAGAELIALADVGTLINIASETTLTEGTGVTTNWAFHVDAIDVSTDAVAINTFGYAIGHFRLLSGA